MSRVRLPVLVTEIVVALEREAGNTDTDPRWVAATALRKMADWERRTLMCWVDTDPTTEIMVAERSSDPTRGRRE